VLVALVAAGATAAGKAFWGAVALTGPLIAALGGADPPAVVAVSIISAGGVVLVLRRVTRAATDTAITSLAVAEQTIESLRVRVRELETENTGLRDELRVERERP
jgi:hypothetical protein